MGTRRHGEGSVTAYQTKGGKRYRYQLRVPTNPEKPEDGERLTGKGGFADFDEAFEALRIAKQQKRLGKVATGSKVPTLADYAEDWISALDTDALSPATIQGYKRLVRNHITPDLGRISLDQLTAMRISRHYRELRKTGRKDKNHVGEPLSLNTINKVHVVLGAILDSAVESGFILQNPAKQKRTVKAPTAKTIRAAKSEVDTWTGEELAKFLKWDVEVFEDELFTLWRTIAYTGARRSEALALRWSDISFESKRVSIRRALDVTQRGVTKTTKTERPRVLDLDDDTLAALKRYRTLRGSITLDLVRPDAFIFSNLEGGTRSPNEVSRRWSHRVEKAQQHFGSGKLKRVTLKGLRHTHATLLLELGVNPKVVQERLGHSTITTTMNIYSHVTPTIQRSAIEQLASHIAAN